MAYPHIFFLFKIIILSNFLKPYTTKLSLVNKILFTKFVIVQPVKKVIL